MAEPGESQAGGGASPYVVLGVSVVAALACIGIVAILFMLMLNHHQNSPSAPTVSQPITINNNLNSGQGSTTAASTPVSAVASGSPAPFKGDAANRADGPSSMQAVAVGTGPRVPLRPSESQSPVARLMVRAAPDGPGGKSGPLPNRVKQILAMAKSEDQAPPPAQSGADNNEYASAPDQVLAPAKMEIQGIRVEISKLYKTAKLGEVSAWKGTMFLVADITATNAGSKPLTLNQEGCALMDEFGLLYPCNQDYLGEAFPSQALEPGGQANWKSAFVVPDDVKVSLNIGFNGSRSVSVPIHSN